MNACRVTKSFPRIGGFYVSRVPNEITSTNNIINYTVQNRSLEVAPFDRSHTSSC